MAQVSAAILEELKGRSLEYCIFKLAMIANQKAVLENYKAQDSLEAPVGVKVNFLNNASRISISANLPLKVSSTELQSVVIEVEDVLI